MAVGMTPAKWRRRIDRALHELDGSVSEHMPFPRLLQKRWKAMDDYLGPSMGMTTEERWREMTDHEAEILCDATEERAAIVVFG